MNDPVEPKLNMTIIIEGKEYRVVEGIVCNDCYLFKDCPCLKCSTTQREDRVKIILEAV